MSLANNTFVLEYEGVRLLIDPWLEDDLIFFTPRFFISKKPAFARGLHRAGRFDAVILTQHLPDHAHEPTLEKIDKETPIFAPAQASSLLDRLGFKNVRIVTYGEDVVLLEHIPGVRMKTGRGAIVGPPWSPAQLALVFSFASSPDAKPLTVYHEPHGAHDKRFLAQYAGKLDAAIAPVVATRLPIFANYSLVNGIRAAIKLCKRVRPRTFVGFDNSGGNQSGFLVNFLSRSGGETEFRKRIAKQRGFENMRLLFPSPDRDNIVIASNSNVEPEGT